MAIDTRDRRASCLGFGYRQWVGPTPDGAIATVDRQHVSGYYRGISAAVGIVWTDRGREINHVVANHPSAAHYLEAYFRATAGTAYARLYDLDAVAAVAASTISTAAGGHTRVRSAAITLIDGHDYIGQSGTSAADAGKMKAVVVVNVTP